MKRPLVLVMALVACLAYASSAHAAVLTFNQGIDLWLSSSGTQDTGNPNLGWGRNLGVNARNYDSLIKFTDMFGAGDDQIPLESTINSATLYIWIGYDGYDGGLTSSIYQMTYDWNATSTWFTIGSTGGIVPGVNAEASPELQWTGTSNAWSQRAFDLTPSVQDWSDGAGQYGWGFTRDRYRAVTALSLDYSTPSYRPYLVVDFTPPPPTPDPIPEPSTLTIFGVELCTWVALKRRRKGFFRKTA